MHSMLISSPVERFGDSTIIGTNCYTFVLLRSLFMVLDSARLDHMAEDGDPFS